MITIRFHVPAPPLVWDTAFSPPHQSVEEWKQGKGFEVSSAAGARVGISSVEITGEAVVITCAADPGPGALVGYALFAERARMTAPYGGTTHWGQLRDSDAFSGASTQKIQPNYCVAFELTAP